MRSAQLEGILGDAALRGELEARSQPDARRPIAREIIIRPDETTRIPPRRPRRSQRFTGHDASPAIDVTAALSSGEEAVVLRFGRPSLLVRRGTFDVPTSDTWNARLAPSKAKLDAAIRSVGRVEVLSLGIPFTVPPGS